MGNCCNTETDREASHSLKPEKNIKSNKNELRIENDVSFEAITRAFTPGNPSQSEEESFEELDSLISLEHSNVTRSESGVILAERLIAFHYEEGQIGPHGLQIKKLQLEKYRYLGETKNGIPTGIGNLVNLSTKEEYTGEFHKGKMNGTGIKRYSDGTYILGSISNGHFNGQGVLYFPSGDTLKGKLKDSIFNGICEYTWLSGKSYRGEISTSRNLPEGEGTDSLNFVGVIIWDNRDCYKGQVRAGVRHGQGKMLYSEKQAIYSGEWVNDLRHGFGTLELKDQIQRGRFSKDKIVNYILIYSKDLFL